MLGYGLASTVERFSFVGRDRRLHVPLSSTSSAIGRMETAKIQEGAALFYPTFPLYLPGLGCL